MASHEVNVSLYEEIAASKVALEDNLLMAEGETERINAEIEEARLSVEEAAEIADQQEVAIQAVSGENAELKEEIAASKLAVEDTLAIAESHSERINAEIEEARVSVEVAGEIAMEQEAAIQAVTEENERIKAESEAEARACELSCALAEEEVAKAAQELEAATEATAIAWPAVDQEEEDMISSAIYDLNAVELAMLYAMEEEIYEEAAQMGDAEQM